MNILKKKRILFLGLFILFVIVPITYISLGSYNISASLTRAEEKEYLQVVYSLGASMIILLYYGTKWLLNKDNGKYLSLSILNLLGIVSLYLLYETLEHSLVMEADYYFLIVYAEIVIVHMTHHIFSKSSI